MSLTVPCQLLLITQPFSVHDIKQWAIGSTIILHKVPQEALSITIQNQSIAQAIPLLVAGHVAAELKTWPPYTVKKDN